MRELIVSRHQLRWVTDYLGAARWPFPFEEPEWDYDSEDERILHKRRVEQELLQRGLIARQADGRHAMAPLLQVAAELMAGWRVLVDLFYRPNPTLMAACYSDGGRAVRICGDHVEDGTLRILGIDPQQLVRATLGAVPPQKPATIAVTRLPAKAEILSGGVPREYAPALSTLRPVLDDVSGSGMVSVAVRPAPDVKPIRGKRSVCFFDSKGRRYRLNHVEEHGERWAEFGPGSAVDADVQQLLSTHLAMMRPVRS